MTDKIFTFLGEKPARNGYAFIYEGRVSLCIRCGFFKVCHGKLKSKIAYRVVKVMDKRVECLLSGPSLLVRVEPAEVEAAVEVRGALEGALIRFNPQECNLLTCEYFNLCVPIGFENWEKTCRIVRVSDVFTCPRRRVRLTQVSLQPWKV